MQAIILCGGKGMRMSGMPGAIPKSLAVVDNKPLIRHIMNIYSQYGHHDFILPLGYGGALIKEYFMDQAWKENDFVLHVGANKYDLLRKPPNWRITFADTGLETMTGARIKQVEKFIDEDTFLLTYGDGLADIDIDALVRFHRKKGKIVTLTGVRRQSQYGHLTSNDGLATDFVEKKGIDAIINGGFFVCNKDIFRYLSDHPTCVLEEEPLRNLVRDGEVAVFEHNGLWVGVDTPKDLIEAKEKWKGSDRQPT